MKLPTKKQTNKDISAHVIDMQQADNIKMQKDGQLNPEGRIFRKTSPSPRTKPHTVLAFRIRKS